MKTLDINQLDDSDEEMAEILISSGMSRPVARTLTYLEKEQKKTIDDAMGSIKRLKELVRD